MNDEGLPWSNLKGLPHLYHSFTTKGLPQTGLPQKGLSRKMFTTKENIKKSLPQCLQLCFCAFCHSPGTGLPHRFTTRFATFAFTMSCKAFHNTAMVALFGGGDGRHAIKRFATMSRVQCLHLFSCLFGGWFVPCFVFPN